MINERPCAITAASILLVASLALGQPGKQEKSGQLMAPKSAEIAPLTTLLSSDTRPIDLASALQLAGVQNPEILLARERIVEAVALHQLAAAQILPTLNAGTNVDNHNGNLQTSTGSIINVNRGSLYLGLGSGAVGAGTVTIPGLVWSGNVSALLFQGLASKQVVRQQEFANQAVRNQVLLKVTQAYMDLLGAQGRRAVAVTVRGEAAEVARITANFAKAGQGRQADADRAATELEQRTGDVAAAEGELATASARLCQVLGLDPSVRLAPVDGWVVPSPIVPEPNSLARVDRHRLDETARVG